MTDLAEPSEGHEDTAASGWRAVLGSRWVLVSLATFLYWVGAHALRPLVPLRLDELGSGEILVGAIVALFPLSSLGLAIPGGRLVDRVGVRRVGLIGLTGMAVLGAGFAASTTPAGIAVLMVGIGVTELATWISLQAFASEGGTGAFLTRQLALFSLAWGTGIAAGPVIGTALYDRFGFSSVGWFYLASAMLAFVCISLAPRVPHASPAGHARPSVRSGVATMWASAPVRATLLSSFVTLFVSGVKGSFLPLYLERAGLGLPRIGLVLSVMGIASLMIRLPLPWVLARVGGERTLIASMWLSLLPMAAFPFVSGFGPWMLLAVASGVGLGINPPVTVELMARYTDAKERGLAMGLRLTANRVAQVSQPLLFGAVISLAGFASAFAASGVLLAGITGWTQRIARRT